MRKSTVFISAVLTTFTLVMLYGVFQAYQNNVATPTPEVAAIEATTPTLVPTDIPTPTQTLLTPEAAAQLAAQIVGNDNLLSAELSNFSGVDAYLITFTNNDVVYVGMDGQILSIQVAPVVVNVASQINPNKNNNKKKNNSSGGGEGGHESGDD